MVNPTNTIFFQQSCVVWSIKSFPGGKEYLMRAHFGLPSVEGEVIEGKPPIQVKFEIPYFTTSGIQVGYKSFFLFPSPPMTISS